MKMKGTARLSTRKYAAFAAVTMLLSLLVTTALLFGTDLYLHRRYERSFGLNVRGYRGPVAPRKKSGERRVAVVGGSTAFGYGVSWDNAFPAHLERKLRQAAEQSGRGPISVVNLAYNGEGAHSFLFTLRDYEHLDYDLVIFYAGYNDLRRENTRVFRHNSPVFRLTGYFPILPMVLSEKAMALRYGGDLEAAYRHALPVFRPNLVERGTAAALEAAVGMSDLLDRQLKRLSAPTAPDAPGVATNCGPPWVAYCRSMREAVGDVLTRGRRALVVAQPYVSDRHEEQHAALETMLREQFPAHPRLHYADLGRAVNLWERALAYDGLHLTPAGNERIANGLVEPTRRILE